MNNQNKDVVLYDKQLLVYTIAKDNIEYLKTISKGTSISVVLNKILHIYRMKNKTYNDISAEYAVLKMNGEK